MGARKWNAADELKQRAEEEGGDGLAFASPALFLRLVRRRRQCGADRPGAPQIYQPTAELAPGGQVDHVSRAPLFLAAAFSPCRFCFFIFSSLSTASSLNKWKNVYRSEEKYHRVGRHDSIVACDACTTRIRLRSLEMVDG
jgi:hypothetical protein